MNQALALEVMLSGESVFLTGAAGAGKTYVLNQFIRLAKRQGKHVSVTATTGLAATHLGGNTIHAWSGIGIHDELPNKFLENLSKTRREVIENTDVLIIDEISMLHDYRLDLVDQVARQVRKKPDVPFGGIQLIMCGDFFQLPPINRGDTREGSFVTESQAWSELDPTILYLTEQHRQDDDAFLEILNALRGGDIRRHHAETLMSRMNTAPQGHELPELHTVNVDVDRINEARLGSLDGDEYAYTMSTTGSDNYVEGLKRSCLALETLRLKKGALVMAIKNALDRKYVNGSVGTVTDFDQATGYPVVKFLNGKTVTMSPESWELRDGDKKRAGLVQIPLRLAWAMTVHKSQGMTLDEALIDLRRAFVEGMGYVALSRVRSLDGVYLEGINNMALRVSAVALEIDERLRTKAAKDAKRFEALQQKADKRSTEAPQPKSTGTTSQNFREKIDKMRQTYPNAFKSWPPEDDTRLKELFLQGNDLKSLSTTFGRHQGSIAARLKKHFGDDAVA
jgi:ATP-dependent DNA helicase PIF1